MIIHQPEIVSKDAHTVIFAKIELKKPLEGFPEYIWYRIPDKYSKLFTLRSDAFLVSGIVPGMNFGEDIEVRGPVAPRLVYHLEEYQSILKFNFPDEIHKVEIKTNLVEKSSAHPVGVGATFSGGVDSLFTLWKHLPENQLNPDFQISHCIFIHGFDMNIRLGDKFWRLYAYFHKALKEINIELIPIETNLVRTMIPRNNFLKFPSHILASCAHLLGGLFRVFYIPSSRDYNLIKLFPYGSTPLADSLLSTETLEIVHHGSTHPRVEKVKEISNWEFAQKNLRVCTNPGITWNCSQCEKCTRTMIPLYALDRLDKFVTFGKPFQNHRDIIRRARKFDPKKRTAPELLPFAKKHKPEIIPWLRITSILGYVRFFLVNYLPNPFKNWLQKYGYYLVHEEEPLSIDMLGIHQSSEDFNDHPPA